MRSHPPTVRSIVTATLLGLTASVVVATPAHAATLDLAFGIAATGAGPFTPNDGPGEDSGPLDDIVRTNDTISYYVSVSANAGDSVSETVTMTAPPDTEWASLPPTCSRSGSSVSPSVLVCNLGDVPSGSARAVRATLKVLGSAANGRRVTVAGTVSDASGSSSVIRTSEATIVSAAPRYDLTKNAASSIVTPDVVGPDGTVGLSITYPVGVAWVPSVAGQGILGFERLRGPIRFADDVSQMFGGQPSSATLLSNAPGGGCGLNTRRQFSNLPAGKGGGARAVVDSGTFTCSQAAPGAPIDVTIDGTDTSLSSVPTQSASGGSIVGGPAAYVIEGYISLWLPTPGADEPFDATNVFSPLEATSISGQSNFPGSAEPLANNSATRTLTMLTEGRGFKVDGRVLPDGSVSSAAGKTGDPYVTAGQLLRSNVQIENTGLAGYSGSIACDAFDNTTQSLARGPKGEYAVASSPTPVHVEYSAATWTTPQAARDATCADEDGPWFSSPEQVAGGVGAVGRVRLVTDLPGLAKADLFVFLEVLPADQGAKIRNFGSLFFGSTLPTWRHDHTSADVSAGGFSDFVTETTDLARITMKVVDPGSSADDTPDATRAVVPGSSVEFAVYPTLSNQTPGAAGRDLTVTDLLPVTASYEPGSAFIDPTSVSRVTDADGNERELVVWSLRDVRPNTRIAPITYSVAISSLATAGSVTGTVTLDAPSDISPEPFRQASRALVVQSGGGVAVETSAIEPVVVAGDRLGWNLGYVNTEGDPLVGIDLIDVLPFVGDGLGSSFSGTARLADEVEIDDEAGETVEYTAVPPGGIALDGDDPSNQAGGATVWCKVTAFGDPGCPSALSDVTALRVSRSAPLPPDVPIAYSVFVTTDGERDGDVFVNRAGLRAAGLLPVQSTPAAVSVVSGAIGDRVWHDVDHDGVQEEGEPGVAEVAVRLTGRDDHGVAVSTNVKTDSAGHFLFDGLRPGAYRLAFTAPAATTFTARQVGGDRTVDSDPDDTGVSSTLRLDEVTVGGALSGVDRDTSIDAGFVDETDPVVDPIGPVDPVGPPDGDTGSAAWALAGAGAGAGHPRALAFTGAGVPMGQATLAIVAVLIGVVLLVGRRRRREQP